MRDLNARLMHAEAVAYGGRRASDRGRAYAKARALRWKLKENSDEA